MKVKVKETQEIINVEFAHTVNYGGQIEKIWQDSFSGKLYPASLLEQIIEEKMVNKHEFIEKACKWLYNNWKGQDYYSSDIIEGLRKAMEE